MKPYLTIVCAVSLWGTWPLWLRASRMGSGAQAFWSLALIGVLGLLASRLPRLRGRPARAGDAGLVVAMGVAAAVNQLAYFAAFESTTVTRAAMAHYLAPCALPYLLATTTIVATINELAFLGLATWVAGFVPTVLFYGALARVPAQHAAVLTYLEPVVSAVCAALFLAEALGARGLVGAACVLAAGVAVVVKSLSSAQG